MITMLVYDVWINDGYVGRFAEAWGTSALIKGPGVRCNLVTDAEGRLARV